MPEEVESRLLISSISRIMPGGSPEQCLWHTISREYIRAMQ